jgi:hypothetical protein
MNMEDYRVFKWIHDFTNHNMSNKSDNKNIIYKELIIRNMVMNITSPNLFKYIKKNKI